MKNRNAFTLIELLVVVTIIALLIAIMSPALSKAMTATQIARCISNTHQIDTAIAAYLFDSKTAFPSLSTGVVDTRAYYGGKQGTEGGYLGNDRPLNRYVGVDRLVTTVEPTGPLQLFRCPADNGAGPGGWNATRTPTIFDCFGASYIYNSGANDNLDMALWNRRLPQITSPTRMVTVCDYSFDAWGWKSYHPTVGQPFQYMYWHSPKDIGFGAVAFVDGHALYAQATEASPDYQNGDGYTFVYNK